MKKQFLLDYAGWLPTPLENAEKLEQLRIIEHGIKILVPTTTYKTVDVNSPEDIEAVKRRMISCTLFKQDTIHKNNLMPTLLDWSKKEKLTFEKESLGIFISGHPYVYVLQ